MANNTNTTTINSTILLNKVNELANQIKAISQSNISGQTTQDLVIAANQLMGSFFNQLSGPIFDPDTIVSDTKPDVIDYNSNLTNILSDLNILFAELANMSNLEIA
ncbi:MAG TPA: hypothetical protein VKR58_03570, partial [Aquella sp.]|nr:hypothetical protein [Aquella sp.]